MKMKINSTMCLLVLINFICLEGFKLYNQDIREFSVLKSSKDSNKHLKKFESEKGPISSLSYIFSILNKVLKLANSMKTKTNKKFGSSSLLMKDNKITA